MEDNLVKKIISEIPKDVVELEIAKAKSEQDILFDVIVPGIYIKGITQEGKKFKMEYQKEFEPKRFVETLLGIYNQSSINLVAENLKKYYEFLGIEINIKNCTE